MTYGINLLSIIAVRESPSDKAEMVNQLLFGEVYKVEQIKDGWAHIASALDNYPGWIDKKQLVGIGEQEYRRMSQDNVCVCTDYAQLVQNNSAGELIPVPAGSIMPQPGRDNQFTLAGRAFRYEGVHADLVSGKMPQHIGQIASMYRGAPYLWGGKSHFGLDCSGLTQLVYRIAGYQLPRDASQQADMGHTVDFISSAKEGDLLFFDNAEGEIIHVGIYINSNKIIHAHGKVRLDPIDHQGIYNKDNRQYSHKLRIIKRITEDVG